MTIPVEGLEAEFLLMPTSERDRVLDCGVESLDADAARDAAWDAVAAQREAEAEQATSVWLALDALLAGLHAEVL